MAEENTQQKPTTETREDKDALELVTLKEVYGKSLKNVINVEEEKHKELKPILQRIADENKSILMSFIAPWGGKKVNPYDTIRASIRTSEEMGVEKAISDIKAELKEREITGKNSFMLLVNSPGGAVDSSYIVSKMIRDNFDSIRIFVPHMAASGGTLLALAGNEIVMGEMSRLSPLDTQIGYKGETVSAQSYRRAIERFEDYFKDKNTYEVTYVWKAMAEKFDHILREEWDTELDEIFNYVYQIMKKSGYKEEDISWVGFQLIFTQFPHSFVIDRDRAEKSLHLNVKKDIDYPFLWEAMKAWYSVHLMTAESKHIIRYVIPSKA